MPYGGTLELQNRRNIDIYGNDFRIIIIIMMMIKKQ